MKIRRFHVLSPTWIILIASVRLHTTIDIFVFMRHHSTKQKRDEREFLLFVCFFVLSLSLVFIQLSSLFAIYCIANTRDTLQLCVILGLFEYQWICIQSHQIVYSIALNHKHFANAWITIFLWKLKFFVDSKLKTQNKVKNWYSKFDVLVMTRPTKNFALNTSKIYRQLSASEIYSHQTPTQRS